MIQRDHDDKRAGERFEIWLTTQHPKGVRRRSEYVLDHHYEWEQQGLALMSRLLDPIVSKQPQ